MYATCSFGSTILMHRRARRRSGKAREDGEGEGRGDVVYCVMDDIDTPMGCRQKMSVVRKRSIQPAGRERRGEAGRVSPAIIYTVNFVEVRGEKASALTVMDCVFFLILSAEK